MPKSLVPGLQSRSDSGGNRASRFDQRDRRDERRDRQRSPPARRRSRSPPPKRRSRSPKPKSRSRSPKRKPRPAAARYLVTISPLSLDTKACTVLDIKNRYSNMYVPSDFYHQSLDWSQAFPLHRPFSLGNPTKFHICHRDVDPLQSFPESMDPPDADYTYSAKVMLLAQPALEDIYKQCCSLAEDGKEDEYIHPTRLLQFLVGIRSKNEPLAIGGPWSPSLDGPDPANNPQTLIKTAIRTTKTLTGLDLSACTQWYRFVDISYLRGEEVHKGKTIAEHTEHVVIFLPDIWSVVPTMMEYLSLQASYKHSLLVKLGQEPVPKKAEETPADPPADPPAADEATPTPEAATAADNSQSQDVTTEEEELNTSVEPMEETEESVEKPDPTHWSKLDPKTMKVVELRTELEARNLSCKGLKTQLQAKLSKALKVEMEKEEEKEEETVAATDDKKDKAEESVNNSEGDKPEASATKEKTPELAPVELTKEEKEKKAREAERQKAHLERQYTFPEEPVILVHPNRAAKNGKFDCSVMSLSVLLDYRPEDNKEHSFEVSLFAESFNEMLMRDFGFTIYKKVRSVPEKKEEPPKKADDATSEKKVEGADETAETKVEGEKTSEDSSKRKNDTEKFPEPKKRRREENDDDDDKVSLSSSTADRGERGDREDRGSNKKRAVEVERRKWITVDRAALLAFVYYDTSHCGYITNKDLEAMFYTLGLQLSRAQIRLYVQKVCTARDSMQYRKLTDRPEIIDGSTTDLPEVELELDPVELATGNKPADTPGDKDTVQTSGEEGVIVYKGAVLDLDKVMDKLGRSETSRLDVEKQMRALQEQTDSLKNKLERGDERVKKLTSDLKRTSDKLSSTKSERNRREDEVLGLRDVLHTTSRELHKVVKLVDSTTRSEEKETKQSGSERYTPSRESSRAPAESNGTSSSPSSAQNAGESTPADESKDTGDSIKDEEAKTTSKPEPKSEPKQ